MKTTTTPNPDRVFEVIAGILQRRYDVKIEYTILKNEGGKHEHNHH